MPLGSFLPNCNGPPQGPLVGPWALVPRSFDYKLTVIHVRHLTTKFHHFLTIKTYSNRLGHSNTFWTIFRTSRMFLDILIVKLPKWLKHVLIYWWTMLELLYSHVRIKIKLRLLEYYKIHLYVTFVYYYSGKLALTNTETTWNITWSPVVSHTRNGFPTFQGMNLEFIS